MNKSPDPRDVIVTFRVTPTERKRLDRLRGKTSLSDFIRSLVFGEAK